MKTKKIFLVEDDKAMALMIIDHLSENKKYEVTAFSTGEECIKHLNENPDLIILDYLLNSKEPNAGNGLKILQRIKKVNQDFKVVMLSSEREYQRAVSTIANVEGAAHYVIKDEKAFINIDTILGKLL